MKAEDIKELMNKAFVILQEIDEEVTRLDKFDKELEGKNIRLWNENERLKKQIIELGGKVE